MMPDREKVIKGLETIKQFFGYGLPSTAEMFDSYYGILNDAIAMLKEQEELLHKKEKDIDKLCVEISRLKHQIHDNEPTFDDWYCADGEKRNDLE